MKYSARVPMAKDPRACDKYCTGTQMKKEWGSFMVYIQRTECSEYK